MTRDAWLADHAYLRPVADLQALVDRAAASLDVPAAPVPRWEDYADEFRAGVPLLKSERAEIDLAPAEAAVPALLGMVASAPGVTSLVSDSGQTVASDEGLLRYAAWAVLVRYLEPVLAQFSRWRDEERWLRNYCPTCGARPAMGQLIGKDPGRLRLLSCGACRTRWRYRRTGCPFCERADDHRLTVLSVEGEGGLRIDYCDHCHGYLKTYDGEGSEGVLLADWTSLHLDVLAQERGLKRLAGSLYGV
jgi:FdhE protein